MSEPCCADCGLEYINNGFQDFIIPNYAWDLISPTKDSGGLLCACCICKRLNDAGITCEGAFMSGPIRSVSSIEMQMLRDIENIITDKAIEENHD